MTWPRMPCGRAMRPTTRHVVPLGGHRSRVGPLPARLADLERDLLARRRSPAAATSVRNAAAVRPCRPMTLPRSSGRHEQLDHRRAALLGLGHAHLVGVIDQRAGEELRRRPREPRSLPADLAGPQSPPRPQAQRRPACSSRGAPAACARCRTAWRPSFSQCASRSWFDFDGRGLGPRVDSARGSRRTCCRAPCVDSVTTTRKYGRFFDPVRLKRIASIATPVCSASVHVRPSVPLHPLHQPAATLPRLGSRQPSRQSRHRPSFSILRIWPNCFSSRFTSSTRRAAAPRDPLPPAPVDDR